jgi:membrane-bound ClpP family serine protease
LPGFGIFGLGGGLMVLVSLILASQTFVLPHNTYQFAQLQSTLLVLVGAAVGAVVAAVTISRWLPGLPAPGMVQAAGSQGAMSEYDDLVGARGTTTTQLTPSGKARVEGRLLDVIADCELVERGTQITIVEVHGNRIFVRPIDEIS